MQSQGDRVIEFIETFCTLGGSFLGQPFKLLDFQKDIIQGVYVTGEDGRRTIRTACIGTPRKNGKTSLIAALCVYGLIADTADTAPVVIAAAGDRNQARLVHDEIKRMILASPELSSVCEVLRNEIRCTRNQGVARVVSADSGLALGTNPSMSVVDEYLVHSNDSLYQALTLGSAARNEPLTIVISTAGYDLESPLGQMYRYGRKVESGEIDDPSFYFRWFGPEDNEEIDASDPKVWERCNPAWEFLNQEEFGSAFKRTPSAQFQRFRLNQWSTAADHWLPTGAFEALASDRRLQPGERVVLSFDGAVLGDSTALVATTVDEPRHVELVRCWEKPTDQHDQGWRTPVHEVKRAIYDAFDEFTVVELAADPWRWTGTLQELSEDDGLPVVEFPTNSVKRMSQATQLMYDAVIDGLFTHDGNPQMVRHFQNCYLKEDSRGARVQKQRRASVHKIDIAVAALIGLQRACQWREEDMTEPQLLLL